MASPDNAVMRMNRRGMGVLAILVLIFAVGAAGLFFMRLARHAGRTSHWFHHAQLAFSLADAGSKQAVFDLSRANSSQGLAQAGALQGVLTTILTAVRDGTSPGPIKLYDTAGGGPLSEGLQDQLGQLTDYDPELLVTVSLQPGGPLLSSPIGGIPVVPGERKGQMTITSVGTIESRSGVRVSRVVTLAQNYKVIQILPDIFGRFSLFVGEPGSTDPNIVQLDLNPTNGDALIGAGPRPLVIQGGFSAPIVAAGTNHLDRPGFVSAAGSTPGFLDRQGWIYLGSSGNPWNLRLAHGFSDFGESPLLPGYKSMVNYGATQADDDLFRDRFSNAFGLSASGCGATLDRAQGFGLYHVHHGFCLGYPQLSIATTIDVGDRANLGPPLSSCLRLFGTPDEFSPTLVFGPIDRVYAQRATLKVLLGPPPPIGCNRYGEVDLTLFSLDKHGANFQPILAQAFEATSDPAQYDQYATSAKVDAFAYSMNVALEDRGIGDYALDGVLVRTTSPGPSGVSFQSALIPGLPPLPRPNGLEATLVGDLYDGNMSGALQAPKVYTGMLKNGLLDFENLVLKKFTFAVPIGVFRQDVYVNKQLKIPGWILITTSDNPNDAFGDPLLIPGVTDILSGGLIATFGDIEISGDVLRGSGGDIEPLTLMSYGGDVKVVGGTTRVEACLVALNGNVSIDTDGAVEILGGIASQTLGVDALNSGSAKRTLRYDTRMDMANDQDPTFASYLRVYYEGNVRVALSGGG